MRWKGRKKSENLEDRRASVGGSGSPSPLGGLGGLGSLIGLGRLLPKGKLGIIIIVAVLAYCWYSGTNPLSLLAGLTGDQSGAATGLYEPTAAENELADFAGVVLSDTEDVWNMLFAQDGSQYKEPRMVLFTRSVDSACGAASAAMGPFYCSGDDRIYIDLSFNDDLKNKLDAPGDFAMAYVIAHEVGHHVQHLLGVSDEVHRKRGNLSEADYNELSVRLELQADFYAGVWAHHAQKMHNILQEGDIEEALRAANAIGDDRLQQQGQGYVVPDSFTHGTSEQRVRWFKKGFTSGDPSQGDTFAAKSL